MKMENYLPEMPLALPKAVNREIEKVCRAARHIIWLNHSSTAAWKDAERCKNWNEIGVDVEALVTERWHPKQDKLGLSYVFPDITAAVDFVMHRLRLESEWMPDLTSEARMQIAWCFVKRWGAYNIASYTSLNVETVIKVGYDAIGFGNLVRAHIREMRGTWDEILDELQPRIRELWQFWVDNRDALPTEYPLSKHIPLFPATVEEVLDVLNAE